jgi:hypothetical protein
LGIEVGCGFFGIAFVTFRVVVFTPLAFAKKHPKMQRQKMPKKRLKTALRSQKAWRYCHQGSRDGARASARPRGPKKKKVQLQL